MHDLDTKTLQIDDVDLKFAANEDYAFEGYASVFNGVDSYGDSVLPGAYADTLKARQRPVAMRWNHQSVIGKWTEIGEDGHGLRVKGRLTKGHRLAEDVYALLKDGAVSGLSIGYKIPSGGSQMAGKVRQLKRVNLVEVSVVEMPADTAALVDSVKSQVEACASLADVEALLRASNAFSRQDATALVSRVKAIVLGDRGASASAAEIAALIRAVRIPGA